MPPPNTTASGSVFFGFFGARSEEHTSELQSREKLVCRLLFAPSSPAVLILSLHDALPICAPFFVIIFEADSVAQSGEKFSSLITSNNKKGRHKASQGHTVG